MTNHTKLAIIGSLLVVFVACKSQRPQMDELELYKHPGAQWLSWTSKERVNFVFGYAQGLGEGTYLACRSADDLFEKDVPHVIGHDNVPSTYPSARCRASAERYLRVEFGGTTVPDLSPYSDVITSFYERHPEYRDIQYINLITYLLSGNAKTIDDLDLLAKGGKLSNLPD